MSFKRSTIAGALVVVAMFCALFISGAALNMLGLNYSTDTPDGGLKIHPYTILTFFALMMLVAGKKSFSYTTASKRFRGAMLGAFLTCAVLVVKSFQGDGQSLGFAVDTVVSAFMLAAVLPFTSRRVAERMSSMMMAFIVVESVLAMLEAVSHVNLITIDTWYGAYFRSTSLHGHPLNNALILATVAVCRQTCARQSTSILIFVLTVGALMAFGARGALVVYLIVNTLWFGRYALSSVGRVAVFISGIIICAGGVSGLLLAGVVGSRISQVGVYDDSAAVRLKSVEMIRQLDWWNLLAGNSTGDVTRLMSRADVSVIENFLIGYVLAFGAAFTLVIGYYAYSTARNLTRDAPAKTEWRFRLILLTFFAVALTNNSLMTKTPAFFLLVAGVWCARCRYLERHQHRSSPRICEAHRDTLTMPRRLGGIVTRARYGIRGGGL